MKYRRHPYGKVTSSCGKFKTRAQVNSISHSNSKTMEELKLHAFGQSDHLQALV
jgi:hypothetical protein